MQIKWCCFLLLTHFILLVQLQMCNRTQYEWPNNNPQKCCNKCKPGEFMTKRCTDGSVNTECSPCGINYYMDEHNNEMKCKMCSRCTKANMESKESCTKTRNTVCGCRSGFKCNNEVCDQCVKIPPSPPPPQPSTTEATMTTTTTTNTVVTTTFQDSVWISLSLCCACVCILLTCFILISRHTPACGWATSASTDYCFWSPKKNSSVSSECTEEEEVPMPVQEMCGGKTEWKEEV